MKTVLILLPLLSLFCCSRGTTTSTPKKYQYKIHEATTEEYQEDTTSIRSVLIKMLEKQVNPFDLKTYDTETDLYIDSLVYSPDQLRMIVLIIAKNSATKLLRRENESLFYYDAFYLFCSRESANDPIKVYDYSGYRLSNFYNYVEISEALQEYCFRRLLRREGTEQHYNIDDVRFWSSKDFEWVLNNATATSL